MEHLQPYAALAIFGVAFALIASEKVHRVAVVLGAAGLMTVLGLIPGSDVFYSAHAGIDWDVIFLLLGMMIIVGVLKQTGVFEFLGVWAAKASKGRPYRLLVLLMIVTAVASPFVDNVTTVMLVAPVTIAVCRMLGLAPAPYLIAEVLAANIGGAATLVGDPPNIIIASRAGLDYNDFLVHMTPITVIVFVAFVLLARVLFRRDFAVVAGIARTGSGSTGSGVSPPDATLAALDAGSRITDRALLWRSLAVLAVVTVAFSLHAVIHVEPAIVALLGAGAMVLVARQPIAGVLREVEWTTLVFFMGLFVMVGGLVDTGVIAAAGDAAAAWVGDDLLLAATLLIFGSALLGAFFDNIPYVTAMSPIVEDIAAHAPAHLVDPLWWAFALGADFGGNGTAVAASANIVVLGIAARAGERIGFWQFTRYGIVTTVMSTVLAWLYVWLRYFVLG
jgi:Na+/H+ antiporter NhaD/arsenite permease-like protein